MLRTSVLLDDGTTLPTTLCAWPRGHLLSCRHFRASTLFPLNTFMTLDDALGLERYRCVIEGAHRRRRAHRPEMRRGHLQGASISRLRPRGPGAFEHSRHELRRLMQARLEDTWHSLVLGDTAVSRFKGEVARMRAVRMSLRRSRARRRGARQHRTARRRGRRCRPRVIVVDENESSSSTVSSRSRRLHPRLRRLLGGKARPCDPAQRLYAGGMPRA